MSKLKEKHSHHSVVSLNIGQYYACKSGEVIRTLLGSCVSTCLFDAQAKVAGMNHILLPHIADMNKFDLNARYGIHAMEMLINEMIQLGARRTRLQAKAFGGANVLTTATAGSTPGTKNIEFIKEFLELEKIPLLTSDFGGNFTRVLFFHTDTFEVYIKKTEPVLRNLALSQEEELVRAVSKEKDYSGDIILFDE